LKVGSPPMPQLISVCFILKGIESEISLQLLDNSEICFILKGIESKLDRHV